MNFIETSISGLTIIQPHVFSDNRGYFFESFNQREFDFHFGEINFIQDNESKSSFGVLRGLHFQLPPFTQSKLVRCITGKILDVVVDLRKDSASFGKHFTIILSADEKNQLYIPKGLAHGFVVLTDNAIFSYKVDNFYSPSHDSGIMWNDPELNIDWRIPPDKIQLSEKDKKMKKFSELENPF